MHRQARTPCLWTEMLFDLLHSGLEKPSQDTQTIIETLGYLHDKGFQPRELAHRVRKEMGDDAARRLMRLVSPVSKASH